MRRCRGPLEMGDERALARKVQGLVREEERAQAFVARRVEVERSTAAQTHVLLAVRIEVGRAPEARAALRDEHDAGALHEKEGGGARVLALRVVEARVDETGDDTSPQSRQRAGRSRCRHPSSRQWRW